VKLSKYLSLITFFLILIYLSKKNFTTNSEEVNWAFLGLILLVSFAALFFKKKEGSLKKRSIYMLTLSILGSVFIMIYLL